ncbi:VapC toxin protein [Desulfocucumis palustris]|uniref:Ribonuclease VapC n=2 Tax=Desulfocucumis palustris TaxID=1898651 RepID=A0A2L2X9F9_9FIRM|nr:type II toxin-antitoxin system VapC family toxin [Desulfocucumis palustris]GBF32768.1 VapC toxin protein [Desulfocucumis palustris]
MRYMLDTNICIYIIKKKPIKVVETLKRLDIGDVCISTITLAELEYGVEKSQHREKNKIALTSFLSPLEILPFSEKAAAISGEIRATLEKKGQIIGAYDLLIAAHALSESLILVTNNTNEFKRIPSLTLQNWVD